MVTYGNISSRISWIPIIFSISIKLHRDKSMFTCLDCRIEWKTQDSSRIYHRIIMSKEECKPICIIIVWIRIDHKCETRREADQISRVRVPKMKRFDVRRATC
ncbi:hypothetical protein HanRHA438_Chr03g0116371 [Helianthus annuus]|nr:hypothetical protein HanRHA438_Chr03g0116371 [Helianthus annuus]